MINKYLVHLILYSTPNLAPCPADGCFYLVIKWSEHRTSFIGLLEFAVGTVAFFL